MITAILIILITILCTLLLDFVWTHSIVLENKSTDVLMILGYKCENNQISPLLKERLNVGLELLRANKFKRVIVTGGKVVSNISEAEIMKRYLVQNGIEEGLIILETEAKDTIENLLNCKAIMTEEGFHTCTVVSNSFHLRRIRFIANYIGLPINVYCKRDIVSIIKQTKLTLSEIRIFIFTYLALKKYKTL